MSSVRLIALVLSTSALLAGCGSSGGASVSAAPAQSIPSPTASPSASATVTATPIATPPASSPTGGTPTTTPTTTASASNSSAVCPTSSLGNQTFTWTLNKGALTIAYPPYDGWTLTAAIPASSPASTVVTVSDSQNNFDGAPLATTADPAFGMRAKDYYASFSSNMPITFGMGGKVPIPLTYISSCITSGTTYYLDLFENNTYVTTETATGTSGQLVIDMDVIPNPLPSGLIIDAVLSH